MFSENVSSRILHFSNFTQNLIFNATQLQVIQKSALLNNYRSYFACDKTSNIREHSKIRFYVYGTHKRGNLEARRAENCANMKNE